MFKKYKMVSRVYIHCNRNVQEVVRLEKNETKTRAEGEPFESLKILLQYINLKIIILYYFIK